MLIKPALGVRNRVAGRAPHPGVLCKVETTDV